MRARIVLAAVLVLVGNLHPRAIALPTWAPPAVVATVQVRGDGWYRAGAADFNNDGLQDFLFTQTIDGSATTLPVKILVNDGRGAFVDATESIFVNAPPNIIYGLPPLIADFNNDGRPDAYISDFGPHNSDSQGFHNTLILSTRKSRLTDATASLPAVRTATGHGASAGDIDNDGDLDIYVGNICCGEEIPYLLINDGRGRFTAAFDRLPPLFFAILSSDFVDVDLDGDVDLVTGGDQNRRDTNLLLTNDGAGFFSVAAGAIPPKLLDGATTLDVEPLFLDRDEYPDLVYAYAPFTGGSELQVLVNQGDGTFRDETGQRMKGRTDLGPIFHATDIDGDGDVDIFANHYTGIVLNNGKGRFKKHGIAFDAEIFPGRSNPDIALIDIDGDGGRDFFGALHGPSEGEQLFAVVRSVGPPRSPSIPLRATATRQLSKKVIVSWGYAWGAASYEVWRSDTQDGPQELVGETRKLLIADSAVRNGTPSYYRVRSKNSSGVSEFTLPVLGSLR